MLYGPAEEKSRQQFLGLVGKLVRDAPTLTNGVKEGRRAAAPQELAVYESRAYRKLLARFLFFTRCLWKVAQCEAIFRELERAETTCGPFFYLLHFGYTDALTYAAIRRLSPEAVMAQQRAMVAGGRSGVGDAERLCAFNAACEYAWCKRPVASAVAAAARGDVAAATIAERGSGRPRRERRRRVARAKTAKSKSRSVERGGTGRLPDSVGG